MNPSKIKFGTDGWRGVIADTYTFEHLEQVAAATGRWLQAQPSSEAPSVVIGYDTRFMGSRFSERTAQVLASMGVRVRLSSSFTTTPAVSLATVTYGCDAGIVITASHNPPEYSGYKLKASFGGPAPPDQVAGVEQQLTGRDAQPVRKVSVDELMDQGMIEETDLEANYLEELRSQLDIEAIRSAGVRVAYDAMYGAGQGIVDRLLGEDHVVRLHHDYNPSFKGRPPEPIARNLPELPAVIRSEGCDAGMATDGDGDRIGMYDENGKFVDPHRILALLVRYLYREKGRTGTVVKTITTTDMLDKMGEAYGLPVETTPVGFKYIAAKIVGGDVLVAGEESGGIAVQGYIPERDGILIGLYLVEMMVKSGKTLSQLIEELFDEFGPHHYHRQDLHIPERVKHDFLERIESGIDEVAGYSVRGMEDMDGFKFRMDPGWVMVRASGTEPVLRIYAEADTEELARRFVKTMVAQVEQEAVSS